MTRDSVPKIGELEVWLATQDAAMDPQYRRLILTAVRRLSAVRHDSEPDDVEWFSDHATELSDRLIANAQVTVATAATYASRARGAVETFLAAVKQQKFGFVERVVERALPRTSASFGRIAGSAIGAALRGAPADVAAEIDEAMVAMVRWPHLRPFLLPVLAEAVTALTKKGARE